jgi:ABC-2 type transport system ATP-binding protein
LNNSSHEMLKLSGLAAWYGSKQVLFGIDLSIATGSVLGLLGPNGSGKSTLMRCLVGNHPIRGSVRINQIDLQSQPESAKAHLGFAPDPTTLPAHLTARQCLQLFQSLQSPLVNQGTLPALKHAFSVHSIALPDSLLALAEQLRFTRFLDSYVDTLSLGSKQKLCVLLALVGHPKLLVLDEVFNGLDPQSAYALKQILRDHAAAGGAIMLATHGLDLAQDLLSELVILGDGRIHARFDREHYQALRMQDASGVERAIIAALNQASGV